MRRPQIVSLSKRNLHTLLRAQHEACNARLKYFKILQNAFRHNLSLHSNDFCAVSKVVYLAIRFDEPLFVVSSS